MATVFEDYVETQGTVQKVTDPGYDAMDDYLVEKSEESFDTYKRSYMAAATFDDINVTLNRNESIWFTGWFNNEAYHTPGITLSLVGNALLDYFVKNKNHDVEVSNHPLPLFQSAETQQNVLTAGTSAFMISYNITFGMAFLVSTFVLFLVRERVVKAKHCQFLSGVHAFTFWTATFVWDFINFLLVAFLIMIVLAAFQVSAYVEGINAG